MTNPLKSAVIGFPYCSKAPPVHVDTFPVLQINLTKIDDKATNLEQIGAGTITIWDYAVQYGACFRLNITSMGQPDLEVTLTLIGSFDGFKDYFSGLFSVLETKEFVKGYSGFPVCIEDLDNTIREFATQRWAALASNPE